MNSSVDANILLRYFLNDVPKQYKKTVQLFSDSGQIFYVYDIIIAEVIYNLQLANISRENIVKMLQALLSRKNFMVNQIVLDKALPFYAEHPALSFVDCLAAFYADENAAEPLWTFDRKLSAQHPSAKRP